MSKHQPYGVIAAAIIGMVPLPMLGLWLAGKSTPQYAEFPPVSHYIEHAPFSWIAFIAMAIIIAACCLPFIIRTVVVRNNRPTSHARPPQCEALGWVPPPTSFPFPWWGWASVVFTLAVWVLAWKRFSWASSVQAHTFFPLWLGYIGVFSGLTVKRKGSCLLTSHPIRVLLLFVASAVFWWYFEYLNRFVQNWFYFGVNTFSATHYFWFATLPFATVLPAVLATNEWLETFPGFGVGLDDWIPLRLHSPKRAALAWMSMGTVSLLAIGLAPNLLYPTLWLSPLIIMTAAQTLAGTPTIFAPLALGNWKGLFRVAIAALICGFFWEMWNSHSEAGWIYEVPFVGRFKLFEMPILGFAGYLPFGLECAVFAKLILKEDLHECATVT